MSIAGIDLSSRFIDVVLLDEDSDAASWHRFELSGQDAFDRARSVRAAMPSRDWWADRGVIAVGIEQPRGHFGTVAVARVQGAILACLPTGLLVQPWNPSSWRTAVGLKGNASKDAVADWVARTAVPGPFSWPQDAKDAYAIAIATRSVLQQGDVAA